VVDYLIRSEEKKGGRKNIYRGRQRESYQINPKWSLMEADTRTKREYGGCHSRVLEGSGNGECGGIKGD